jgi:hypothetical protein
MRGKTMPWREILLCTGLFGLLGPFVGALEALAFGCAVDRCVDAGGSFVAVLPPVFFLAYLIGIVPACLTGIAMALQARRARSGAKLLLRSVLTGGVIAGLCFGARLAMETSLSNIVLGGYAALLMVAAIGAIASLICTAVALHVGALHLGVTAALGESI